MVVSLAGIASVVFGDKGFATMAPFQFMKTFPGSDGGSQVDHSTNPKTLTNPQNFSYEVSHLRSHGRDCSPCISSLDVGIVHPIPYHPLI